MLERNLYSQNKITKQVSRKIDQCKKKLCHVGNCHQIERRKTLKEVINKTANTKKVWINLKKIETDCDCWFLKTILV